MAGLLINIMRNSPSSNNLRPKPPVAWLLGRDLIASLQGTLLYTAFGSKLDPRLWMKAKVVSFTDDPPLADVETVRLKQDHSFESTADEFWFDYIADTGDGTKATYSVAYLALSNLYVKSSFEKTAEVDQRKGVIVAPPDQHGKTAICLRREDDHKTCLPRGAFLLVGGDTSYHLSDYATLANRFYKPFRWAFRDLWYDIERRQERFEAGKKGNGGAGQTTEAAPPQGVEDAKIELSKLEKRRPLFGIPGNHDYYDQLDGFRRQFQRPVDKEENDGPISVQMPAEDDTRVPQLMIPGFRRLQEASYVALQLPFSCRSVGGSGV